MLKGISPLLSPDLLKVLAEMGHGDFIVLADANFPSESMNGRVIRADGHSALELLKAILPLFPLDTYTPKPCGLMQLVPGDKVATPIWVEYQQVVAQFDSRGEQAFENIERFAFYEKAKKAYCVVATGEKALYANLILQKGVIT